MMSDKTLKATGHEVTQLLSHILFRNTKIKCQEMFDSENCPHFKKAFFFFIFSKGGNYGSGGRVAWRKDKNGTWKRRIFFARFHFESFKSFQVFFLFFAAKKESILFIPLLSTLAKAF